MAQLVQHRDTEEAEGQAGSRWTHPFTLIRRIFGNAVFSSLTRRILFFNLAALIVLVGGILYLNQFREGLIDARVESLLTQGEIIAGAVSASASVDTNSITIDPEKLLELQAGQSITPAPNDDDLEFPIDPEKVAPVLRRLISPTRTRARIFDADANLLLDSRHLYSRGQVLRYDLPPVDDEVQSWSDWFSGLLNKMLQPANLRSTRKPRRRWLHLSRGDERTHRCAWRSCPQHGKGRADRFRRRPCAARPRRAWRPAAFHPGR